VFSQNIQPPPGQTDTDYIALFHSLFPPIAESVRSSWRGGSARTLDRSEEQASPGPPRVPPQASA
jgi:hypothetical protein